MVRFDDSLTTVLTFDTDDDVGARSAWRQLVDLAGRGRVPADDTMMSRLRAIRKLVPDRVRVATARSLATGTPDPRLVALFAEDILSVTETLLTPLTLDSDGWKAVVPRLTAAQRSILRSRSDLPEAAVVCLKVFEPVDTGSVRIAPEPPAAHAPPQAPHYPLADLVARIERFRRSRVEKPLSSPPAPATRFAFRADTNGTLVVVDGVTPGALVGMSLSHSGRQGAGQVDGVVAGAFRRRSRFADARLEVGGESDAAGSWRLSGVPSFDAETGRFTGYDGVGRRPRPDENAASTRIERADSLRQIVHELRTPANAISGFAELIEAELAGPVPAAQRSRATAIRQSATDLVAAIDDLDTAARIDGRVLELRPAPVALAPLIDRIHNDLTPLIDLRRAIIDIRQSIEPVEVLGDDRLLERLLGRLIAVLVAAAASGERLTIAMENAGEAVRIVLSRPASWQGFDDAALFSMEPDGVPDGAPLLGTGFCLRLVRKLASKLGGRMTVESHAILLRLPALPVPVLDHASIR